MNDSEYIKRFTVSNEIENNRYSCLIIALEDSRMLTGRNLENGKYDLNILRNDKTFLNPNSFIGIINYLLFLEMIGEIFRLKSFKTNKTNNIFKALKQFGNSIPENDINTIIALRNSLAHNYGLINTPKYSKENPTKRHKFIIDNSDDCLVLIKYPTKKWDGDYTDKSDDSSTIVSSIKLIELIESIYRNLRNEIDKNSIELSLKGGIEELKSKFTIRN